MNSEDTNKSYLTILTISCALILASLIFEIKNIAISAVVLSLICIFFPKVAEKISFLWMKFAQILGLINGKILLSVVFFFILLPLSILSKLFGKSTIVLKKGKNSYYNDRQYTYTPTDFENTW